MTCIIGETQNGQIWGTPLYDRSPMFMHSKDSNTHRGAITTNNLRFRSNACYVNLDGSRGKGEGEDVQSYEIRKQSEMDLSIQRGKHLGSRVTLLGDAAHPMSMFKGQGANQALEDGPLLCDWLIGNAGKGKRNLAKEEPAEFVSERKSILAKLRNYEREMILRSRKKQEASRSAAKELHSNRVKEIGTLFGFEGVQDQYKSKKNEKDQELEQLTFDNILPDLLCLLKTRNVTAQDSGELTDKVRECIIELLSK